MREIIIGKNDAGQRLDKFITKAAPMLPKNLLYKYLRIKRIKINGKKALWDIWCSQDYRYNKLTDGQLDTNELTYADVVYDNENKTLTLNADNVYWDSESIFIGAAAYDENERLISFKKIDMDLSLLPFLYRCSERQVREIKNICKIWYNMNKYYRRTKR